MDKICDHLINQSASINEGHIFFYVFFRVHIALHMFTRSLSWNVLIKYVKNYLAIIWSRSTLGLYRRLRAWARAQERPAEKLWLKTAAKSTEKYFFFSWKQRKLTAFFNFTSPSGLSVPGNLITETIQMLIMVTELLFWRKHFWRSAPLCAEGKSWLKTW